MVLSFTSIFLYIMVVFFAASAALSMGAWLTRGKSPRHRLVWVAFRWTGYIALAAIFLSVVYVVSGNSTRFGSSTPWYGFYFIVEIFILGGLSIWVRKFGKFGRLSLFSRKP